MAERLLAHEELIAEPSPWVKIVRSALAASWMSSRAGSRSAAWGPSDRELRQMIRLGLALRPFKFVGRASKPLISRWS